MRRFVPVSICYRGNPHLTGISYFHDMDRRHAAQPNINPFVEICKGVAHLPSVVLVLAEKTLLEADEIQRTVLSEEPCEKANAKVLSE